MLAKLFLKYLLATVFGLGVTEGYATRFGEPGDPLDGDVMACGGEAIPQDALLCAHRYLPCGTEITVVHSRAGAITTCTVADRGPYGVRHGQWRGLIDLTPGAANEAGVDGRHPVRLFYQLPKPGHPMYKKRFWLAARHVPGIAPPKRDSSATLPDPTPDVPSSAPIAPDDGPSTSEGAPAEARAPDSAPGAPEARRPAAARPHAGG